MSRCFICHEPAKVVYAFSDPGGGGIACHLCAKHEADMFNSIKSPEDRAAFKATHRQVIT